MKRRKATDRSYLQTEKIIFVDTQAYFFEKFQSLTDAFSFRREKNETENVKREIDHFSKSRSNVKSFDRSFTLFAHSNRTVCS